MTDTVVGFDVTPLEEREPTGVGRYAERLLAALVARGGTHRYHLLASRPLHGALPAGVVGPAVRRFPTRWLWVQAMLPVTLSRLRPRVCHFTNGMAPVGCPCPYVLTLYDMSLFLHARTQPLKSRLLIRSLVPWVARRAAAVITATNSAHADIIRVLGLPPGRVQVVSGGVDPAFQLIHSPDTLDPVRRRYGLDRPFILTVGTLEPRKNLGRLTRAFGQLRAQGRKEELVLVGRSGWGRDEARRVADELGIAADCPHTGVCTSIGPTGALRAGPSRGVSVALRGIRVPRSSRRWRAARRSLPRTARQWLRSVAMRPCSSIRPWSGRSPTGLRRCSMTSRCAIGFAEPVSAERRLCAGRRWRNAPWRSTTGSWPPPAPSGQGWMNTRRNCADGEESRQALHNRKGRARNRLGNGKDAVVSQERRAAN